MRVVMLLHKSVEYDSRVRREATALVGAGHDVFVLELAPVSESRLDGFTRVSVLPPPWVRRVLPFHLYRVAFLLWFVRAAVRLAPDAVHAHDAAMLVPGWAAAALAGAALVYDSHELATGVPYRERGWGWLVAAIERVVVPRCAAVITVSDGIAGRIAQRYALGVRPTVVRNVSALSPAGAGARAGGLREALGLGAAAPLVLHQGAPAPDRGCEVLVDAVAQLSDDVGLVFLGDPEPGYGRRLSAHIAARGMAARVTLLDSVPLERLLAFTAEADVGVTLLQDTCENHRLALPNKLFEYIAAGVPVVGAALPEIQRLLESYGVGCCADPASPTAVAAALTTALAARGDPALSDRLARAAAELSWEHEQLALTGLYAQLERDVALPAPSATPAAPLVLQLVRNDVSHDARVLRAAGAAQAAGARATVIGVATATAPAGETALAGAQVIRLAPGSRLGSWRRLTGQVVAGLRGQVVAGLRGQPSRPPSTADQSPRGAVHPSPPAAPGRLTPAVRLRRAVAGGAFALQAVARARRLGPSVVHANDWNTMWAALATGRLCGAPVIYDSHELWADRNGRWESRRWLLACEWLFVHAAARVLVTSPGHGAALAARNRIAPPRLIRNVPETFHRGDPGPVTEPPTLAYVGGVMPGRGLEQAIDALVLMPDVSLRVVGPAVPAYAAGLIQHAERAGVAARLHLDGAVAPAEIGTALAGSLAGLCLIQPVCRSYELCLPNKLFEYVAAGLPVIASDLPVIGPIVAGQRLGAVVPPGDAAALAAAVAALREPLAHAAATAAVRGFVEGNPAAAEQALLVEVYAELLGRP